MIPEEVSKQVIQEIIEMLLRARRKHTLGELSVKDLKKEGREE